MNGFNALNFNGFTDLLYMAHSSEIWIINDRNCYEVLGDVSRMQYFLEEYQINKIGQRLACSPKSNDMVTKFT